MFPEGRAFEFLILAVVALVVVGPKDLPILLRKVGQFMAKVRSMAAEFRASFDEMARQSELDELRKEVEAMRQGQLADMSVAPEVNHAFNEISQGLSDVGVRVHAPYTYDGAETTFEATTDSMPPKGSTAKAKAKAAVKKAPTSKARASKAIRPTAPAQKALAAKTAAKAPAKAKAAPKVTPIKGSASKTRARRVPVS